MQDAGPIAGAAHAPIRQPHHVLHALLDQLLRHRQHAPLGEAGTAQRSGHFQDQHARRVDVEFICVDPRGHVVVVLEHDGAAGVLHELGIRGAGLDDRTIGREVAAQHDDAARGLERLVARQDHVGIPDLGAFDVLAKGFSVHGFCREVEQVAQLVEQGAQSPRVEEILHEVLVARRPHVGDDGGLRRDLVVAFERKRQPGASRHRNQMHNCVGRAAHRHQGGDRIVERPFGQEVARLQILPHHLDDAPSGQPGHARVVGVRRGNRRITRQRESQRFGKRHHRRGRAHGHAGPRRARDSVLDLVPVALRDAPGAQFVPVFPGVRTRPQRLVAPVRVQHRACGQVDRRQVHAGCAHDQRRGGLVAAAHDYRAVGGVRPQQLLGLHGEEVAIHHRGRLLHRLGERHRRHLERKAAGLPDPALHFLDALLEVGVAMIDVRPRVDDRDHRLACIVGAVVAHLRGSRAVAEGTHVIDAEPAVAAKFFGFLFHLCSSYSREPGF